MAERKSHGVPNIQAILRSRGAARGSSRARSTPIAMKYFLCKFIPPRRDFLLTMTSRESQLMKEHVAFMNALMGNRQVVAHGPVDDPAGGWGLSLYEVEDNQDVAAMTSEDPMVKSGGAHYEVYPMRHLTVR